MSTTTPFLIRCSNKEQGIMKLSGREKYVAEGFQKGMACSAEVACALL